MFLWCSLAFSSSGSIHSHLVMTHEVSSAPHYPQYYIVTQILHCLCLFAGVCSQGAETELTTRPTTLLHHLLLVSNMCFYPMFSLHCLTCLDITYLLPYLIMLFSFRFTLRLPTLAYQRESKRRAWYIFRDGRNYVKFILSRAWA